MLQYHRKRTEKQGGKREAETAKAHEGTRGREVKVAKRLLLVDDEAAIIKGLKFSLEQDGYEILTAYDGTKLEARNIIGSFDPENSKRVLLFAHWDSRPYSDHDPDPSKHRTPLDGADDGGSGVGALLEIARQIGQKAPGIGIDIIFFDAEDYGTPEFVTDYTPDSWCLGTQFWAKNPHVPNYTAEYGILLDMVGGKNATFFKEQQSLRAAAPIVEMVWSAARDLGYGKYFINATGGALIDDHQYVISGRNIPSIDIINYDPESKTGFASYWHTQKDNMENIDRETLKAAGQTVLEVIYNR